MRLSVLKFYYDKYKLSSNRFSKIVISTRNGRIDGYTYYSEKANKLACIYNENKFWYQRKLKKV